jgi:Ca2+:H+ antiporter
MKARSGTKKKSIVAGAAPIAALASVGALFLISPGRADESGWQTAAIGILAVLMLLATVIACSINAQAVSRRVGQPFGTLVLTLSVTIIEASIVGSLMLHGDNNPELARDTILAVVMLTCTGLVGTCLVLGSMRHSEQLVSPQVTSAFLSVLVALVVLLLILPNYLDVERAGAFSPAQLGFVALISLMLYGMFLYIQTVAHREQFVDKAETHVARDVPHAALPAFLFLVVGLLAIVLLAKEVAADIEDGFERIGLVNTDGLVGAIIALLILLPEATEALRVATGRSVQASLNIALGSALATIGLTVPAVAALSLATGRQITLGLGGRETVLVLLTLGLSVVSFGSGRTNMLTGTVHLVVFAVYALLLVT